MQTDQTPPVVETPEASGSETKEELIPYSTYKKALSEKRNVQSKMAEYETELKQFREEKLASEGKTTELLDSLRKENSRLMEESSKVKNNFAWNALTNSIKSKAVTQGLRPDRVDKFIRLMDDEDLKSIEVDSSFNVNEDDLVRVLEKAKKDVPEFFAESFKIADKLPTNKKTSAKSIKDMTDAEIKQAIEDLGRKQA